MKRYRTCDFATLPQVVAEEAVHRRVVAFDVFDTLLCRHVAPEDVKVTCARELARRLGDADAGSRLYELRRQLEDELCAAAARAGHDPEFRHDDLMRRWAAAVAPEPTTLGAELAAHELAYERLVTAPTPSALAAITAARAAGARVVWVSDNYLPASAIDGLLAAHRLRGAMHAGFVSATDLHTKRSGRLFLDLMAAEGIAPEQLLVVGDDRHADRDAPLRLGSRSIWVRDTAALARRRRLQVAHRLFRRNPFFAGHRLATAASFPVQPRPVPPVDCPHRQLGHLLGVVFSGFALFVHERARASGLRHLFFLSREGETFLRLYRRVARTLGEPAPRATYFCASRRSTFLPSLDRLDAAELGTRLWPAHPRQTLHQLLADLSLPRALDAVGRAHGLDDPQAPLQMATEARVAAFLADQRVQTTFVSMRDAARAQLRRYAAAKGLLRQGPIGFVDIGWHGSAQNNLLRALRGEHQLDVEGFYLALADASDDPGSTERKHGYLCDRRRNGATAAALLQNGPVFEMFATAAHGAVTGYTERRGRPRPVLTPEARVDRRLWREVRAGLFESARACIAGLAWLRPTADELRPWLLDRIHRYVHYPTLSEARAILAYHHSESFGADGVPGHDFAASWRGILFGGAPWRVFSRAGAAFAHQPWPGAALRRSLVPGLCYVYDRYRSLIGPEPRAAPDADDSCTTPTAAGCAEASTGMNRSAAQEPRR